MFVSGVNLFRVTHGSSKYKLVIKPTTYLVIYTIPVFMVTSRSYNPLAAFPCLGDSGSIGYHQCISPPRDDPIQPPPNEASFIFARLKKIAGNNITGVSIIPINPPSNV
jgi:hypothetical protein